MAIERRDTRARCFLFGDRRSVEATLASWAAWRDPAQPARGIQALRLSGETANVLATVAGIRAVERLRGAPFGFALRAELTKTRGPALAASGARTLDAAPAGGVYFVVDADDGQDPGARRLREALRTHLEGVARAAPVLILAHDDAEPRLRLGARPGRVERVYSDLAAPLLSPIVEAILLDMLAGPGGDAIVVCGQGDRVAQAALGAGDLFIEYDGGPPQALDRARLGAQAARVVVARGLLAGAGRTVSQQLGALGVELADRSGAEPEGLVLEPVV